MTDYTVYALVCLFRFIFIVIGRVPATEFDEQEYKRRSLIPPDTEFQLSDGWCCWRYVFSLFVDLSESLVWPTLTIARTLYTHSFYFNINSDMTMRMHINMYTASSYAMILMYSLFFSRNQPKEKSLLLYYYFRKNNEDRWKKFRSLYLFLPA